MQNIDARKMNSLSNDISRRMKVASTCFLITCVVLFTKGNAKCDSLIIKLPPESFNAGSLLRTIYLISKVCQ